MEDYEIIEAAADYIEEHGWCKRVLRNKSGEVCVDGALLAAHGWEPEDINSNHGYYCLRNDADILRIARRLVLVLDLPYANSPHASLYFWNDNNSKQGILDSLRKAAKIMRVEDEYATRDKV